LLKLHKSVQIKSTFQKMVKLWKWPSSWRPHVSEWAISNFSSL